MITRRGGELRFSKEAVAPLNKTREMFCKHRKATPTMSQRPSQLEQYSPPTFSSSLAYVYQKNTQQQDEFLECLKKEDPKNLLQISCSNKNGDMHILAVNFGNPPKDQCIKNILLRLKHPTEGYPLFIENISLRCNPEGSITTFIISPKQVEDALSAFAASGKAVASVKTPPISKEGQGATTAQANSFVMFHTGDWVEIHSTSRADLNGKTGVVVDNPEQTSNGRVAVFFKTTKKSISFRPDCLTFSPEEVD